MDYFVLAGGFWGQSRYSDVSPRQVDPKSPGMMKGIDYIIGIEGIPAELLQPEEETSYFTYWCTQCKKPVHQNLVEHNQGCALNHKVESREVRNKAWRTDVFEEYNPKTAPWIKGYRIWMDNNNGVDKWKQIYAVLESNCRAKGMPVPLPVRLSPDGRSLIMQNEVPVVVIDMYKNGSYEKKENVVIENKKEDEVFRKDDVRYKPIVCDICGTVCKGNVGLASHKRNNHKDKQDNKKEESAEK